MHQYIQLIILTMFESIILTLKAKSRIYNHDRLANVLGALMKGLGIIIAGVVIKDSTTLNDIIYKSICIFISAYLGNVAAIILFEKIQKRFVKDDKWIYLIIPNSRKDGKLIADTLEDNNIEKYTIEGYNDKRPVLPCIVFSYTKDESSIVKNICNHRAIYKRI